MSNVVIANVLKKKTKKIMLFYMIYSFNIRCYIVNIFAVIPKDTYGKCILNSNLFMSNYIFLERSMPLILINYVEKVICPKKLSHN